MRNEELSQMVAWERRYALFLSGNMCAHEPMKLESLLFCLHSVKGCMCGSQLQRKVVAEWRSTTGQFDQCSHDQPAQSREPTGKVHRLTGMLTWNLSANGTRNTVIGSSYPLSSCVKCNRSLMTCAVYIHISFRFQTLGRKRHSHPPHSKHGSWGSLAGSQGWVDSITGITQGNKRMRTCVERSRLLRLWRMLMSDLAQFLLH